MAFAQYEMRVVLAAIFSRVDLRAMDTGKVVAIRRGISLAPRGGVRVMTV